MIGFVFFCSARFFIDLLFSNIWIKICFVSDKNSYVSSIIIFDAASLEVPSENTYATHTGDKLLCFIIRKKSSEIRVFIRLGHWGTTYRLLSLNRPDWMRVWHEMDQFWKLHPPKSFPPWKTVIFGNFRMRDPLEDLPSGLIGHPILGGIGHTFDYFRIWEFYTMTLPPENDTSQLTTVGCWSRPKIIPNHYWCTRDAMLLLHRIAANFVVVVFASSLIYLPFKQIDNAKRLIISIRMDM